MMTGSHESAGEAAGAMSKQMQFLTVRLGEQLFGLPLARVQEVLDGFTPTPIRLAAPEIAGAINLRGRILAVIDVRRRLGLATLADGAKRIGVVVDHDGEPYDLIFDAVGDVVAVRADQYEPNPPTLDPRWRTCCAGLYRLDPRLMVVLRLDALLDLEELGRAEREIASR